MEDLKSFGLRSVEHPPIPPPGLELLMEELESLGLRLVEHTPSPSVWRLAAVPPKDTV